MKDNLYPLPTPDLLNQAHSRPPESLDNLKARGGVLISALQILGIQAELIRIIPGPVITKFEIMPESEVRLGKIINLSNDLSLAFKGLPLRIIPVIGSQKVVDIEIPNDCPETVNFIQLLESPEFQVNYGALTIILGHWCQANSSK